MTGEEERWHQLMEGLRSGDGQVIEDFWKEYGPLLHQLADRHLAKFMRRRIEAEDVVQSAFRTFLRRVRVGQFQLEDNDGLWRLLCAITLNKLRWQTRYHLRRKRGLDREVSLDSSPGGEKGEGFQPADPSPNPADVAEFADQFGQLLNALDEEERQIVELKLQDYTNDEVAERLGTSERTVRRILHRVKVHLSRALETT
jgi:RNA polymerase sigma-70 factor (ECF subfamily)